jgi:heme/copper-type cytochrome/quinol oxidase subunit 2
MSLRPLWLSLLLVCSFSSVAKLKAFYIELKDHIFVPERIELPANKKVKLIILNRDTTAEEFDSFDLNREKVLFPNRKAVIFVGPLKPGEYEFFGEFNPDSARGFVVVKEPNDVH